MNHSSPYFGVKWNNVHLVMKSKGCVLQFKHNQVKQGEQPA